MSAWNFVGIFYFMNSFQYHLSRIVSTLCTAFSLYALFACLRLFTHKIDCTKIFAPNLRLFYFWPQKCLLARIAPACSCCCCSVTLVNIFSLFFALSLSRLPLIVYTLTFAALKYWVSVPFRSLFAFNVANYNKWYIEKHTNNVK